MKPTEEQEDFAVAVQAFSEVVEGWLTSWLGRDLGQSWVTTRPPGTSKNPVHKEFPTSWFVVWELTAPRKDELWWEIDDKGLIYWARPDGCRTDRLFSPYRLIEDESLWREERRMLRGQWGFSPIYREKMLKCLEEADADILAQQQSLQGMTIAQISAIRTPLSWDTATTEKKG